MMSEGYEMREMHRTLLARQRMYLLHNTRPTESLLSALLAREVLSHDMCDEIKAERTAMDKVAKLLDLLPSRGPAAFDGFCESLLESDHSHVAEYLKQLEATDMFRHEITPHCSDITEHAMEKFINIFKKSTPTVSRFAEQKFQLILDEQEAHLKERETEMRDLRTKLRMKELEVSQLANFTNSCCEIVETLANELQRDFLSKSFLKEEKKHIENMKYSVQDITGLEKTVQFYGDMQTLLTFLESHTGLKRNNGSRSGSSRPKTPSRSRSGKKFSLREKLNIARDMIIEMIENMGTRPQVSGALLRMELEKLLKLFQDLNRDVDHVAQALKASTHHKNKLESEIVLLMHSNQEVRRIEREIKEKQNHISELTKNFNLLKRKGPGREHRKQLQQIHITLQQKKLQLSELQKSLGLQIDANDEQLQQLLGLLPDQGDENDNDLLRDDTMLTMASSRLGTPDTISLANNAMVAHKKLEEFQRRAEEKRARDEEEAEMEAERQREKLEAAAADKLTIAGQSQGGLLQRRRLKQQGRVAELKAETQRDTVTRKSTRAPAARGPPGRMEAREKTTVVKKENTGIDLDSWVQQQKSQSKTEQLHKKLAEFTPKPTEDRTAELKRVLKNSSDEDTPRKKEREEDGGDDDEMDNEEDDGATKGDGTEGGWGKSKTTPARGGAKDVTNKTGASHNNNPTAAGDRLQPGGNSSQKGGTSPRNVTHHPGQPPGANTSQDKKSDPPDRTSSTNLNIPKEGSGSSSNLGQGSRSSSSSHNSGSGGSGGGTSRMRKISEDSVNARKSRESPAEKSGSGGSEGKHRTSPGEAGSGGSDSKHRTSPGERERTVLAPQAHMAVLDPGIPVTGGRKQQAQRLDGEILRKSQQQPLGRQSIPMGIIDFRLPSK